MSSVASSIFLPNFYVTEPEYGYFIRHHDQYSNDLILNLEQSHILLNRDRSDPRTLLNSDNMRDFLDFYSTKRYNHIMNRFKLSSIEQVDAFYDYIEYAVKKFFRQDSDYNNIAMGSLM